MSDFLLVEGQSNELLIVEQLSTAVVVQETTPQAIEVITAGPQGPPGPSTIAGFGFAIDNLSNGDLLAFSGSNWTNKPKTEITDGGNF